MVKLGTESQRTDGISNTAGKSNTPNADGPAPIQAIIGVDLHDDGTLRRLRSLQVRDLCYSKRYRFLRQYAGSVRTTARDPRSTKSGVLLYWTPSYGGTGVATPFIREESNSLGLELEEEMLAPAARILACLCVLVTIGPVAASRSAADPDIIPEGLARVFEPGLLLEDRNGDDRVDFVSARLVVPESPAPEEVAAAAAVAARLGFETSGLSLPLVFRAGEASGNETEASTIVIGGGNPRLPEAVRSRIAALEQEQGLVKWLDNTIVIAGKHPVGTRTAAESFASRSPYLWDVIGRENGDTFERVSSDLVEFLGAGGVEVSQISFEELLFEKDRKEVVTATATVRVTEGSIQKTLDLFQTLAGQHARGENAEKLSYSSVAEWRLQLNDGLTVETLTLARVGAPQRILTPPREGVETMDPAGEPPRPRPRDFDLSDLFTVAGLLQDTDRDRIPDTTETILVLPSKEGAMSDMPAYGTAHLAARIGLESTGVAFPLVKLDSEIKDPEKERSPVLLGGGSQLAVKLDRLGKRRAETPPAGIGVIEVVPKAFKETPAVVVTGGDREGAEAATDYLARRAPYLWTVGRGEPTLEDIEDSTRKLLNGKTAAGQAALALARLDEILTVLEEKIDDENKKLERVSVEAFFEEPSPALDRYISEEIGKRLDADTVEVKSRGRRDPEQVFEEKPELEWEVDGFWKTFREKALPKNQIGLIGVRRASSERVARDSTSVGR